VPESRKIEGGETDPARGTRRRAGDEHDRLLPERYRILAERYTSAAPAADILAAEGVIDEALSSGTGAAAVHSRIIAPAMHVVGERWSAGLITVADETSRPARTGELGLTVSVGVSRVHGGARATTIAVDRALYQAKSRGPQPGCVAAD
jgi:cytosine/adenosine deaminase-related metal-dependent hydrolase